MKQIVSIFVILLFALVLNFLCQAFFGGIFNHNEPEFGNWAMWVGDIVTIGATAVALATLFFMKKTHEENKSHNEKMWKKQEVMLDFQKYREHKQQFYSLLDDLEKEHSIKFYGRSKFYESLFPLNNFGFCEYDIELGNVKAGDWENIEYLFNEIITSLNNFHKYSLNQLTQHAHKHFELLWRFSSILHIDFPIKNKLGDLYFEAGKIEKIHVVNIFDSFATIHVMHQVFVELLNFSGSKNSIDKRIGHLNSSFYKRGLLSCFRTPDTKHYGIHIEQNILNDALKLLIEFCDATDELLSKINDDNLQGHYNDILYFFDIPDHKNIPVVKGDILNNLLDNQVDIIQQMDNEGVLNSATSEIFNKIRNRTYDQVSGVQ